MNNWTTLLSRNNLPDTEQRDYIRNVPEGEKQIVFEGVYLDDQSSSVTPHYHKDHVDARRQLKDSTKKGCMYYKAKYAGQRVDILQGMFHGNAANSANWKLNWNTLIGGINYQHPHTDTGRVGTYHNLDVFPLVGLHGLGLDPFSLWLLPQPFDLRYGFLHTFESHQMLLMRGRFRSRWCTFTSSTGTHGIFPSFRSWVDQSTGILGPQRISTSGVSMATPHLPLRVPRCGFSERNWRPANNLPG